MLAVNVVVVIVVVGVLLGGCSGVTGSAGRTGGTGTRIVVAVVVVVVVHLLPLVPGKGSLLRNDLLLGERYAHCRGRALSPGGGAVKPIFYCYQCWG